MTIHPLQYISLHCFNVWIKNEPLIYALEPLREENKSQGL